MVMTSSDNKNSKDKIVKESTKSNKNGVVVSDKMDKTIVVKVNILKKHPRYQKRYTSSKKYKVHDEKNEYAMGDKVTFEACRPMSKGKQWRAISK
jgi:small subunit ribosomal protein S17